MLSSNRLRRLSHKQPMGVQVSPTLYVKSINYPIRNGVYSPPNGLFFDRYGHNRWLWLHCNLILFIYLVNVRFVRLILVTNIDCNFISETSW